MGAKFMFNIYNPFFLFLKIQHEPILLDDKMQREIYQQLVEDIHKFCSLFSLNESLWYYFFNSGKSK